VGDPVPGIQRLHRSESRFPTGSCPEEGALAGPAAHEGFQRVGGSVFEAR